MERISAEIFRLRFSGWDFQPGLWNRAGLFSPGWNSEKPHVITLKFQPGLKSELGPAQWLCFQGNKMVVSRFPPQFQISASAETNNVIPTKFQPGGRAEISARAEICHVIGHLAWNWKTWTFPVNVFVARCSPHRWNRLRFRKWGAKTGLERAAQIQPR